MYCFAQKSFGFRSNAPQTVGIASESSHSFEKTWLQSAQTMQFIFYTESVLRTYSSEKNINSNNSKIDCTRISYQWYCKNELCVWGRERERKCAWFRIKIFNIFRLRWTRFWEIPPPKMLRITCQIDIFENGSFPIHCRIGFNFRSERLTS